MNTRRDFFKQLAVVAASFAILPAAKTYERMWRRPGLGKVLYELNPDWVKAKFEMTWFCDPRLKLENGAFGPTRDPKNPPSATDSLYPARFNLVNGFWQFVPPFIEVSP